MSEPRIVLFDLETLPNLEEALKVWPQLSDFPGKTLRATVSSIICAGYKVFGDLEAKVINAWDFAEWNQNVNDDFEVCKAIRSVLEGSDAVVTQNGIGFDWKFLNTRLLINGLEPLHRIQHIDTKVLAKSNLFLFNNRLNTLGEFLVGDQKMDHEGWPMWVKVHKRDPEAMKNMSDYCKQDVELLEKVFMKLRPFAKLPNYNLFQPGLTRLCPNCGSTKIRSNGWRRTSTQNYRRYKCDSCHSVFRTDKADRMPRHI